MCFVLSWSSISLLLIVSAASGRPQKNTFVTSTLDLVKKLVSDCLALAKQRALMIPQGDERDRNRNKLLVRRACVAYGAWVHAPKETK